MRLFPYYFFGGGGSSSGLCYHLHATFALAKSHISD